MTTATTSTAKQTSQEHEFVTFYAGDLLIGVDIRQVQEINRHVETTPVPHAPEFVRGVVNLRGDVVTVVDLRATLHMPCGALTTSSRNVIVNYKDELIGLLVDRIADVVETRDDDIDPTPPNVDGVDNRFFQGVCKLEDDLLVLLDVNETLTLQESVTQP